MNKNISVSFEREKIIHMAEHEVLLSFNDDEGAEAFYDWWWGTGKKTFNTWAEKNGYKHLLGE